MKIGLYFGSFNPIHNGHLAMANFLVEYTDIDKLWFVVSPQNPLKEKSGLLADHHRLKLVRLAIENYNKFSASNIEFTMPKPSYTIDTLTYLSEKYPKNTFALIIGADNLLTINKWKNYEQIIKNYEILVCKRPGYQIVDFDILDKNKIKIIDTPNIEISSSFIRKAISENRDVRFFMPEKIFDYIIEMNFYKLKK